MTYGDATALEAMKSGYNAIFEDYHRNINVIPRRYKSNTSPQAAVEAEMDAKCTADYEARVTAEVDRLKAEAEAAKTAQ